MWHVWCVKSVRIKLNKKKKRFFSLPYQDEIFLPHPDQTTPPPHQFQRFQCSPRTLRTLPPRAAAVGWRGRPTGTHHNHAGDQSQQWSPAWREQHPMFEFDLCMDVGSIRRHFQNGSGFLPNCKILSWKWSNDSGHLHTLHDCLEVSAGNRLAIVCSNMQRNHIRVHFSKLGTSGGWKTLSWGRQWTSDAKHVRPVVDLTTPSFIALILAGHVSTTWSNNEITLVGTTQLGDRSIFAMIQTTYVAMYMCTCLEI